jgi:hypothetical protein
VTDVEVLWCPRDPIFDSDGNCLSAVDWLGHRFWVGDQVVYCMNGPVMGVGIVVRLRSEHQERSRTGRTVKDVDEYRSAWDLIKVWVLPVKSSGHKKSKAQTVEVKALTVTWIPQDFEEMCHLTDNLNRCEGGPMGPNHKHKFPFIY